MRFSCVLRHLKMPNNLSSTYSDLATKYESGTGGATRKIARECVNMAPNLTSESVVHDNACGPAIVTSVIMSKNIRPIIHATDFSSGMVGVAKEISQANGWDNVKCEEMDGQNLSFQDDFFTHSFSCLGVFLFPDSKKGVAEMYRTLRPNGWACFSSMKDPVWPSVAERVYKARNPDGEKSLQLIQTPGWNEKASIEGILSGAGFRNVSVTEVSATFQYADVATGRSIWYGQLKAFSPVLRDLNEQAYESYFAQFWEEYTKNHSRLTDDGKIEFGLSAWVSHGTK